MHIFAIIGIIFVALVVLALVIWAVWAIVMGLVLAAIAYSVGKGLNL